MNLIEDEKDPRIPEGISTEKKYKFMKVFNSLLFRENSEAEAMELTMDLIVTPEERLPEGEERVLLPE